jgi:hypothetical protein
MEKDKTPKRPFPPQRSSLGERMNDTSAMMIKKDGKWVWLDNGEEVKNPPAQAKDTEAQATKTDDKKNSYGEFYKPLDK